jgi:hypothetical protein
LRVTGVELIVAALAAGAAAGTSELATAGVRDAYTALRDALRGRLRGRGQAVRAVRAEETEPGVWQARLGEDLAGSGADNDEQILAAAQRLLEHVDPAGAQVGKYRVDVREAKGVQVGDHNTQHNTFS